MDLTGRPPLPTNRTGHTKLSLRRRKVAQPPDTQLSQQESQPSQSHAQQGPLSSQSQLNLPPYAATPLDKLPGFSLVLQRCSPANSPTKEDGKEGVLPSQQTKLLDSPKSRSGLHSAAESHRSPEHRYDDIKGSVAGGIETPAYEHATSLRPAVHEALEERHSSHQPEGVESALNIPDDGVLYSDASDDFGELFSCQLCQEDLTWFSTARRQQHINQCGDEREKVEAEGEKSESEVAGSESDAADSHVCVLCKKVFKSKQPLLAHMKGCARKRGVSTAQLLSIRRGDEASESSAVVDSSEILEKAVRSTKAQQSWSVPGSPAKDADSDFRVPPPPGRPRRGRKRKQAVQSSYLESLEDEQFQLALAMSASLNPLSAAAEVCPSGSGVTRRKRQRRGGGRVAVGNENPPILLLTSSSQAEGVVAQRAEQILTATKFPSAEGGDGSDDEIPCTPAFAASELGHHPGLRGEHECLLGEDERLQGEGCPEMGEAEPRSDVIAISASSSEDEELNGGVPNTSSRFNAPAMEVELGVTAAQETTSSWINTCKSTHDVDTSELVEPGDDGVDDGGLEKQPIGDLVEEAALGEMKEALPLSGEGEMVSITPFETPPRLGEETAKNQATLGGGDTAGLSYLTLWQLSNYQQCEDNADFYVPALASVVSPVKASLCRICESDPCVAVTAGYRSPSDVTITEPSRIEAVVKKSPEHVIPVGRAKTGVARLTSDLHSLVGSSLLSDVTITTRSGSKVPAHASILACRCPALREVLVSPSPSLIPGSAHLDLSDFDDEVVFACLEYLYTGSSPLLQEGGRGSSPLLQEGGRGSSPLEEVLLERFALLAQRLSLEEFAHLFPFTDAYHNSDDDTIGPHVESCRTTHKSTTDTIGSSVVGRKNNSVSLGPEECTSNPECVRLQFHTRENEQGTHLVDATLQLPDEKSPNCETPKKTVLGLSELQDTTDCERYTLDRDTDAQNSNTVVMEATEVETTGVPIQALPCEGRQDSAATARDSDVVYVSSSPEECSEKSPMLDGTTMPDVLRDTGTSPLKLPPSPQGELRQGELSPSPQGELRLGELFPSPQGEGRQGELSPFPQGELRQGELSPFPQGELRQGELSPFPQGELRQGELSPPQGEGRQGEVSPSPQGELRQGELSPSPQGKARQGEQVETDTSLDNSVKSFCSIDSLLTDEIIVTGCSQDRSISRHSSQHCEEGSGTGAQIATPRPMYTATVLGAASTTPILFATPSTSTGTASVAGIIPVPASENSGAMSASSEGSRVPPVQWSMTPTGSSGAMSASSEGSRVPPVQWYMTPAGSSAHVELESDDNITPMPDYRTMRTPMLKGECSRFGVRALPKKKMITKLEEIYDYTHPLVDADGNVVSAPEIDTRGKSKASGSPSKRGKPPAKRRAGKQKSGSQAGSSTASSQADVDLSRQVQECIVSDGELYQDLLLYKPLQLSHIQTRLKSAGAITSKEKLMDLLDHWCVTYSLPRTQKTRKT